MHAFEINNINLGRQRAASIAGNIPGVVLHRLPKRFLSWFREECFCEFELNGVMFQIDEPYGDNSRYWIGQIETGGWSKELETIESGFRNA